MPFENEHSARLITPPKTFIRVRRTSGGEVRGKSLPKSISTIWYVVKRNGKEVPIPQALRFKRTSWTVAEAKKWLKDNKFSFIRFEAASATS